MFMIMILIESIVILQAIPPPVNPPFAVIGKQVISDQCTLTCVRLDARYCPTDH